MFEEHKYISDVKIKSITETFEMRIMAYLESLPEEEYCKLPCRKVERVIISEKGKRRCCSSMKKSIKVR